GGDRWSAPIGIADEPEHQRQRPFFWERAKGGLALYGVGGSGTTTALATLAVSLARAHTPAELHLYVLDFGTQALAPLAGLPHVGRRRRARPRHPRGDDRRPRQRDPDGGCQPDSREARLPARRPLRLRQLRAERQPGPEDGAWSLHRRREPPRSTAGPAGRGHA